MRLCADDLAQPAVLAIPICLLAAILAQLTLRLKVPRTDIRQKLGRLDVLPNLFLIASSVSFGIGATFGGVRYPWASARVLVPIVLGVAGICAWPFLGARAAHPESSLADFRLQLTHQLIAIVLNIVPDVSIMLIVPLWLQAVAGKSPTVCVCLRLPS